MSYNAAKMDDGTLLQMPQSPKLPKSSRSASNPRNVLVGKAKSRPGTLDGSINHANGVAGGKSPSKMPLYNCPELSQKIRSATQKQNDRNRLMTLQMDTVKADFRNALQGVQSEVRRIRTHVDAKKKKVYRGQNATLSIDVEPIHQPNCPHSQETSVQNNPASPSLSIGAGRKSVNSGPRSDLSASINEPPDSPSDVDGFTQLALMLRQQLSTVSSKMLSLENSVAETRKSVAASEVVWVQQKRELLRDIVQQQDVIMQNNTILEGQRAQQESPGKVDPLHQDPLHQDPLHKENIKASAQTTAVAVWKVEKKDIIESQKLRESSDGERSVNLAGSTPAKLETTPVKSVYLEQSSEERVQSELLALAEDRGFDPLALISKKLPPVQDIQEMPEDTKERSSYTSVACLSSLSERNSADEMDLAIRKNASPLHCVPSNNSSYALSMMEEGDMSPADTDMVAVLEPDRKIPTETDAALCIQKFMFRYSFYKVRSRHCAMDPTGWIRPIIVNGHIEKTTNYSIVCEALHMCLDCQSFDIVPKTIQRVVELSKLRGNEEVLKFIPMELLVRVLIGFQRIEKIALLGLEIIYIILKHNKLLDAKVNMMHQNVLVASGIPDFVVSCINIYSDDGKIATAAAFAVHLLATGNSVAKDIFHNSKIMKVIMKVLTTKNHRTSVFSCYFSSLTSLCEDHDRNIAAVFDNYMVDSLMDHIGLANGPLTEKELIGTLRTILVLLCPRGKHCQKIQNVVGSHDKCSVFVSMLQIYVVKPKVVGEVCSVILAIVQQNEDTKRNFTSVNICDDLLEALMSTSAHVDSIVYIMKVVPVFVANMNASRHPSAERIKKCLLTFVDADDSVEKKKTASEALRRIESMEEKLRSMRAVAKAMFVLSLFIRRYLKRKRETEERMNRLLNETCFEDPKILGEAITIATKANNLSLARRLIPFILEKSPNFFTAAWATLSNLVLYFTHFFECEESFAESALDSFCDILVQSEDEVTEAREDFFANACSCKIDDLFFHIIERYAINPNIVFKSTRCIYLSVFRNNLLRGQIRNIKWCGVIHNLMVDYKRNSLITENCLILIEYLCIGGGAECQSILGECGVCRVIVDIMELYKEDGNARLLNAAGRCVVSLSKDHHNNKTRFVQDDTYCETFLTLISKHWRENDQYFWCVITLSNDHSLAKKNFAKVSLLPLCLILLRNKTRTVSNLNNLMWAVSLLEPQIKNVTKGGLRGIHKKILATLNDYEEHHIEADMRSMASAAVYSIYGPTHCLVSKHISSIIPPIYPNAPLHNTLQLNGREPGFKSHTNSYTTSGTGKSRAVSFASDGSTRGMRTLSYGSDNMLGSSRVIAEGITSYMTTAHKRSVLTPDDAAHRIQTAFSGHIRHLLNKKAFAARRKYNWAKNEELMHAIENSSDHDIIKQALVVSAVSNNVPLFCAAVPRVLVLYTSVEVGDDLPIVQIIDPLLLLLEQNMRDNILCNNALSAMIAVSSYVAGLSPTAHVQFFNSINAIRALYCTDMVMKCNKEDCLICYKACKVFAIVTSLSCERARFCYCSTVNINLLVELMWKHRKNGSFLECAIQTILNACKSSTMDNSWLFDRLGRCGLCKVISQLINVNLKHTSMVASMCQLITALCAGHSSIQKIMSTRVMCGKWCSHLAYKNIEVKIIVLRTIFCIMGANGDVTGHVKFEVEPNEIRDDTKFSFFTRGLLKQLIVMIQDKSSSVDIHEEVVYLCQVLLHFPPVGSNAAVLENYTTLNNMVKSM